ncbi:MAG TPA: YbaB/EbfC family nucleoid-associated protein [Rhizomicrobium sp.]
MDIADLFKQAQEVQAKAQAMQEQLGHIEAEGVSGAGLVRVLLNGKAELRKVSIDASLLRPEGQEIIEDLIIAAHRDAKTKVERQVSEQMAKLAQDMGLPPEMMPR